MRDFVTIDIDQKMYETFLESKLCHYIRAELSLVDPKVVVMRRSLLVVAFQGIMLPHLNVR